MIEDLYKYFRQSTGVSTDSRLITEGSVFFALKGENFDGNMYAAEALEKGAMLSVIDDERYNAGEGFFLVEDVLKALQDLATYYRKQINIPIIALTGTNGKTTSKELIRRVLATKYKTLATIGNLNNHIGVPVTILNMSVDDEIGVIEMGANHVGEIADLCNIAAPTHGMITNIGKAHLEGFGGLEGVIRAKSELYDHLLDTGGIAFVNLDDPLLMKLASPLSKVTYGADPHSDVNALLTKSLPFLELMWQNQPIETNLYGDYNFENVMAAICIGKYFDIDPSDIVEAIASYIPENNRSQLLQSGSNKIYLDAYNANPSSMSVSISHFQKLDARNKVLILGDMLELGDESQAEHKKIISEIADKFSRVILVGPEFVKACSIDNIMVFSNTTEAAAWMKNNPLKETHVLIKGSRGIALESLLKAL